MLFFVVIFNLGLTVLNLYILFKIRRWTKNLKTTTKVLSNVEYHVDRVLNPAPEWVMMGQKGTSNLRLRLQILAKQLQVIETLLRLFTWLDHKSIIKIPTKLKR